MAAIVSGAKIAYQTYTKRFFIHSLSKSVKIPIVPVYVIVPVYAEDNLLDTLQSLNIAKCIESEVCLIFVINCKADDSESRKKISGENLDLVLGFEFQCPGLEKVVIDARNLGEKNAGVGLARKIGMDAVIHTLSGSDGNPWLICLDGDCTVSDQYFIEIESNLINSPSQVAVFAFSHLIRQFDNEVLKSGILQYELYLEYYRYGLKSAGFPFFHHTVGSSMAVTALAYAKSGGMNQRKAGEDFYFLHKLFPQHSTIEISNFMVFPSARVSDRVPFGTGRFQMKWQEMGLKKWPVYNPEIFSYLAIYIRESMDYLKENPLNSSPYVGFIAVHPKAQQWLIDSQTLKKIEISKNASPNPRNREKAFFQFFDGFMALKFVHFFQAFFEDVEVEKALDFLIPEIRDKHSILEKLAFVRKNLSSDNS